jgi:hypothetical protein
MNETQTVTDWKPAVPDRSRRVTWVHPGHLYRTIAILQPRRDLRVLVSEHRRKW